MIEAIRVFLVQAGCGGMNLIVLIVNPTL